MTHQSVELVDNVRRFPLRVKSRLDPLSTVAMSKNLKRRGFGFVGPTVCYAFMQAVGMVNDHTVECFRYREL